MSTTPLLHIVAQKSGLSSRVLLLPETCLPAQRRSNAPSSFVSDACASTGIYPTTDQLTNLGFYHVNALAAATCVPVLAGNLTISH